MATADYLSPAACEGRAAARRARKGELHRAMRAVAGTTCPAIVMVASDGRRTLAIVTAEPYPAELAPMVCPIRASMFWTDGPLCHVTRATLGELARDVAADYCPIAIERPTEDEIAAWFTTEEFAEGARRVAEIQAANERMRS